MKLNNSTLHYTIINTILERGFAPTKDELCENFQVTKDEIINALKELQDYHGVVLHPHNSEIWVIHPFSSVPTGFLVRSGEREWWGNCAWCSLGVAALAVNRKQDVTITTAPGFDHLQTTLRIQNGILMDKDYVVHFPIQMMKAWDNVIQTCAMMLLFHDEHAVDTWCKKHGKMKGDVRPIEQIWEFSKEWYGSHDKQDWEKWSIEQAANIFSRHGLNGPIWDLPTDSHRF